MVHTYLNLYSNGVSDKMDPVLALVRYYICFFLFFSPVAKIS